MQNQKFGIWLITSKDNKHAHLKIVNKQAEPVKRCDTVKIEDALKYAAKDTGSPKMQEIGLNYDTLNKFNAVLLAQSGLKAEILNTKKQIKKNMHSL